MNRGALDEHPQGLYREIREFKILNACPLSGYQKSIEAGRLGKIWKGESTQIHQVPL
jgi:hypothetical protein